MNDGEKLIARVFVTLPPILSQTVICSAVAMSDFYL
jgi:hypothetical protein